MELKKYAVRDAWGLIEVIQTQGEITLRFGNHTAQSGWNPAQPEQLAFGYYQALCVGLVLHPTPRRLNLYGLGGGVLARYLLEYTEIQVHAHDLRPTLADIARQYFGLNTEHPRLRLQFGDICASDELSAIPPADLIWIDLFDEQGMVPIPTRSLAILAEQLDATGVLCINIWRNALNEVTDITRALSRFFDETPLTLHVPDRYNTVLCYRKTPWAAVDLIQIHRRIADYSPAMQATLREALTWLQPLPHKPPARVY
ncbi:MAG: spermidine synthase [Halothiobacillus sp.]